MRLIDADALEKEFCHGCQYENNKYVNCIDCAVANAPTVCKWHDPDEELPKKDGEYLCLTLVHTIPPHWRIDVYRWNKSNFWWNDSEWGEGIADDVCYWTEIPPMPEMDGEYEQDH